MKELNSYFTTYEADIDKIYLESEGIEGFLKGYNHVAVDPMLTNALGGIRLMVHESEFERAKQLLNDKSSVEIELSEEDVITNTSDANLPKCDSCGSKAFTSKKMGFVILLTFLIAPLLTFFVSLVFKYSMSLFVLIECLGLLGLEFMKFKKTCLRCKKVEV
ncbi:DUF2007 domain-containing protein [Fibrobacterales bacterium]|nr:DUF2007 domain-containing protein [Fibrobacterales bacterium]